MKRPTRRLIVSALGFVLVCLAAKTGAQDKTAVSTPKPAVPFVENDYTRALADAQKRNVELFVDLWAPW